MKEKDDEINRLNGVILTKDCIIADLKRDEDKLRQNIKDKIKLLKQNIQKNVFEVQDGEDLEYIFEAIDEVFENVTKR